MKKNVITQDFLREIAPQASLASDEDIEDIKIQLGRVPRGLVGIAARCACGSPAVTITLPRLDDGSPFPTLFYLTLPSLVKEISRLEAAGYMVDMNERLVNDEDVQKEYEKAHHEYIRRRNLLGEVEEISNVSAGGMPKRVKCLHALAGYALAAGNGVCALGDEALERIDYNANKCMCTHKGRA
ncbi:MAG: DUF501 domain-containing protein [Actinomycetaceae bacterium]|nr:DUF501 domain-containing protein [Actinomycetaceae bacterium]